MYIGVIPTSLFSYATNVFVTAFAIFTTILFLNKWFNLSKNALNIIQYIYLKRNKFFGLHIIKHFKRRQTKSSRNSQVVLLVCRHKLSENRIFPMHIANRHVYAHLLIIHLFASCPLA
jgi:hypothetical protein